MWLDAGNSTGNDVHADEKNLLSGCIGEIKEILTRLTLQNSGPVPIRFFETTLQVVFREIGHPGYHGGRFPDPGVFLRRRIFPADGFFDDSDLSGRQFGQFVYQCINPAGR